MAHKIPAELKYTKDHEWTKIVDDQVIIGITDFAQSSLGDIVFTELPGPGIKIIKGEAFGVVESIKSVSDLYSPLDGVIIEKNDELESQPELINQDPYTNWLLKIKPNNLDDLDELLSDKDYQEHCKDS